MLPQNRRDFIRNSALAGIGLGVFGPTTAGRSVLPAPTLLSPAAPGGLALTAAVDDALRLAGARNTASDVLRSALRRDLDNETPGNVALTAGGLRTSPGAVAGLLIRYREGQLHDDPEDAELRLGFALGWFAYRAARKSLAPLYAQLSEDERAERGAYADATVLRGRTGRSIDAQAVGTPAEVGELLALMGARSLVRFHTLNPDYDDIPGWVDRHAAWRERNSAYLRELSVAYADPVPAKFRRHVAESEFYDPSDPVIAAARAVAAGDGLGATDVLGVRSPSGYGAAVQAGASHLSAADQLLTGELSPAAFVEMVG